MTLPRDPTGYAVEETTGIVHKRYADHARGIRRTTEAGVYAVLGDLEPKACQVCWPPPPSAPRTRVGASSSRGGVEVTHRQSGARAIRSIEDAEALIRGTITSESIDLTDTFGGS